MNNRAAALRGTEELGDCIGSRSHEPLTCCPPLCGNNTESSFNDDTNVNANEKLFHQSEFAAPPALHRVSVGLFK